MARKLVEKIFGLFSPPPKINLEGVQQIFVKNEKIKVFQNCLKWRENWTKIRFETCSPPASKKVGYLQNVCQTEKNQGGSELPEMARKLDENNLFYFLSLLPLKNKYINRVPKNKVCQFCLPSPPQPAARQIMTW